MADTSAAECPGTMVPARGLAAPHPAWIAELKWAQLA